MSSASSNSSSSTIRAAVGEHNFPSNQFETRGRRVITIEFDEWGSFLEQLKDYEDAGDYLREDIDPLKAVAAAMVRINKIADFNGVDPDSDGMETGDLVVTGFRQEVTPLIQTVAKVASQLESSMDLIEAPEDHQYNRVLDRQADLVDDADEEVVEIVQDWADTHPELVADVAEIPQLDIFISAPKVGDFEDEDDDRDPDEVWRKCFAWRTNGICNNHERSAVFVVGDRNNQLYRTFDGWVQNNAHTPVTAVNMDDYMLQNDDGDVDHSALYGGSDESDADGGDE